MKEEIYMNLEQDVQRAMLEEGLTPPSQIIADGQIHRFSTNGKRKDRAGFYCFWDHGDDFVSGFFGDWRTGIQKTWHSKQDRGLSQAERKKVEQEIRQAKAKAEAERKRMAEKAKDKARLLWEKAKQADNHPYLVNKSIKAFGIRQVGNALLVPVMDFQGQLHGIQLIYPDGTKRFLIGTPVKGHFFKLGSGEPFYIVEGYATGASIYQAVEGQGAIIVTFNAGNLKPVARVIHEVYPKAEIIVCADNDQWTPGNPGLTKATEAARAIGALLAIPQFQDTSTKPSDFNDLYRLEGLDAVKRCLNQASYPKLSEQEVEAELDRLATLSVIQYDKTREEAAKRLGVRVATLDEEVKRRRPRVSQESDRAVIVEELEPWEEWVNGTELLNEIRAVIQDHVVLKPDQATAISLWVVLTYCYDAFRILPMLALTSPEKRCGKTTLLEVLGGLVKSPLLASNITPAALFRVIEAYRPCLLIDEADTFIRGSDELQGVINSGHTHQGAFVIRVNGETLEPERFSTWGPKVIALIGQLPDTNKDRSIEIRLQRKLPSEKVKRFSFDFADKMKFLRRKLLRWAKDNAEALRSAEIELPNVGNDRAADNWMPLFAIAHVVGGGWPDLARKAMMAIEQASNTATVRQELLADIRQIFGDQEKISSRHLVESLIGLEDRPWAEWWHGKPLTPNGLAKLLKVFGIQSKTIRLGDKTAKGYEAKQFQEIFERYLSPPDRRFQNVTTEQVNKINKLSQKQNVTQTRNVTLSKGDNLLKSQECYGVTLQKQGNEEGGIPDGIEGENLALF